MHIPRWVALARYSSVRDLLGRRARRPRRQLRNRAHRPAGIRLVESRILLNAAGPAVTSVTPTDVRNATFDHIDVNFDTAIDPTTFMTTDVSITAPAGSSPVNLTGVSQVDAVTLRATCDPLTMRGTYAVTIYPNIADTLGRLTNQDNAAASWEVGDVVRDFQRLINQWL